MLSAEKVYTMLGNQNLWETAGQCHRLLADVVELIAIRNLDGAFARFLHKSVRKKFRELVRNARGES